MFTGVADISIPLHNITQDGFTLPISINYHSNGVKVEQTDSWVGTGWSLNAGGVIGRSVVGYPDDVNGYFPTQQIRKSAGYLFYSEPDISDFVEGNASFSSHAEYVNSNVLRDSEPDIFFYNIPGYSGKFAIQKIGVNLEVRQMPQTDLQIIVTGWNTAYQSTGGAIMSFKIIDPNGIEYHFNDKEYSQSHSVQVDVGHGHYDYHLPFFYGFTAGNSGDEQYVKGFRYGSAWYMSKIVLLNGQHITLEYDDIEMDELSMQREQFSGHKKVLITTIVRYFYLSIAVILSVKLGD